jgi:eukaryotic-like serine/threonine-protein kinase
MTDTRAGRIENPSYGIAELLVEQRLRWQQGERFLVEGYLEQHPSLADDTESLLDLIFNEVILRGSQGELPVLEEYLKRFPALGRQLRMQFEVDGFIASDLQGNTVAFRPTPVLADSAPLPNYIGRYRIERLLGKGGFGLVYLAHDERLSRPVAIKVPHVHLVAQAGDAEAYLTEARTVASVDHPRIVPVYDVGGTEEFPCYVVSKFIDGSNLMAKARTSRLSLGECAELVATVAEALHFAHKQGIVHRDIKPSNILLDRSGQPYVADFGLALREQDIGKGPVHAGTPAYMSPEQARGEGHRVDGRSDIFSLGTVLYELLTGRRPFAADSREVLLEQIMNREVRPPRQWDDTIPKELERICMKALSKRASERYTTAKDMSDDLLHFLAEASSAGKSTVMGGQRHEAEVATPIPCLMPTPSGQQAVKIVPKGLRSFDAGDAEFFLELLPGPRDREGLPESIRFWKTRIETSDAENTFSVGLFYGPSGCGKSSLVKAGLLPRLAKTVTAVYIEATGTETEAWLLKGLRRQLPDLPSNHGLIDSLGALRRGRFLESGQKVLLVLDQFEQWLHARRSEENTELVQALRQCDGGRVQCIVTVRDDFWMAATQFMANLEINLVQGHNCAAFDLFDPRHARRVLTAFGRAFGALPEKGLTKEQDAFLDQAVAGLAQDGKVISVRLALFAEMVKGRSWSPATFKEVGGTEGVGVIFLDETFTASTAPPQHRLHQKAAQAVLKALLPEAGTGIKGHMRSQAELLEASGYAGRVKDFDDLIRILDQGIRLITPTDPEGAQGESSTPRPPGGEYYQLTHDYLVPSLRDWLTRRQKETRRGRAELLLADRAAVWNARPENRQLPSLLQWFQICGLTRKQNWTPLQRKMIHKATRYQAGRGAVVAAVVLSATLVGLQVRDRIAERNNSNTAAGLVQGLVGADIAQVPGFISQIQECRPWADPLLRDENDKASKGSREKLHTSLALLPVDPNQNVYLYERLLNAEPSQVPVIRDALERHKEPLVDKLWAVVESPERGEETQRLRAAAALAKYDPHSEKWAKAQEAVANDLVLENPVYLGQWSGMFSPIKYRLLTPLSAIFRDHRPEHTAERSLATSLLADYAADQPQVLAELLMDADEKQFAVIFPKFKEQGERGLSVLTGEIETKLSPDAKDSVKEKLAKRQANAAVALLRMNQPANVWPLLKHSPDPRARSYLIHRLHPLGADAGAIVKHLDEEQDVTISRALLLSLGEYGEKDFSPEKRNAVLAKLQAIYRNDADAGLHAAAEWLLRRWQQEAWLKKVNDGWARDKEQREKRLQGIQRRLASRAASAPGVPPQWYVNGQGQTMVVIPGPVEFVMGSPPTEEGRQAVELQAKKRIDRTFALAANSVTVEQYRKFDAHYGIDEIERWAHTADSPVIGTNWFQATAYCNWLSKQEGLPESEWCYDPLQDPNAIPALASSSVGLLAGSLAPLAATCGLFPGRTDREYKGGMKLARNYPLRKGYRLPTEAELEYATRAGAATSRYFGETDDLLEKYAWYLKNSQDRSWPVGSMKPNDTGLFDVQGNVYTWCQERYSDYGQIKTGEVSVDKDDALVVRSTDSRVLRGASFDNRASYLRSANRDPSVPTARHRGAGFRPARSFTP